MPGGSRTLLNYLQSFGVSGGSTNTGSGNWNTSYSGDINYTANPIANNNYFTNYGRVRVIEGDGSADGLDWAVFNFGPASNGDFDGYRNTYAYFGGEDTASGGTGGLSVITGYVWGATSNGWEMLYKLSLPGDNTNNHTNGNWFTSGGTVTSGNGKRSAFDNSPITHLGFSVTPELNYSFSSHTFTNAGATGRSGPTLSQIQSAYSSASWTQNTLHLDMTTQGIQLWTVPATRSYTIEVAGAGGGGSSGGGYGALLKGTFSLSKYDILSIVVGQSGVKTSIASSNGGGGGGASYVVNSATLLIAAGGGGGGGEMRGLDASLTTSGASTLNNKGGTNGNGGGNGVTDGEAAGGAGWLTDGENGWGAGGGLRFSNGAIGGNRYDTGGEGGFGGGGGGWGNSIHRGGGGGGYSGGQGGGWTWNQGSAGGGGSYNSGTNVTSSIRSNTGHGYVTITAI
jgi:hypothetical protein